MTAEVAQPEAHRASVNEVHRVSMSPGSRPRSPININNRHTASLEGGLSIEEAMEASRREKLEKRKSRLRKKMFVPSRIDYTQEKIQNGRISYNSDIVAFSWRKDLYNFIETEPRLLDGTTATASKFIHMGVARNFTLTTLQDFLWTALAIMWEAVANDRIPKLNPTNRTNVLTEKNLHLQDTLVENRTNYLKEVEASRMRVRAIRFMDTFEQRVQELMPDEPIMYFEELKEATEAQKDFVRTYIREKIRRCLLVGGDIVRTELKAHVVTIATLEQNIMKLNATLDEKNIEINQLNSLVAKLQGLIEQLKTGEAGEAIARLADLEQAYSSLQAEAEKDRARSERMTEMMEQLEEQRKEQEQLAEMERRKEVERQKQMAELEEKALKAAEKVKEQMSALKEEHKEKEAEWRQELQVVNDKLDSVQADLREAQRQLDNDNIGKLEAEIEGLKDELDKKTDDLFRLEMVVGDKDREIALAEEKLKGGLDAVKNLEAKFQEEKDALQEAIKEQQDEIIAYQDKIGELENKVMDLQVKLSADSSGIQEVEKKMKAAEKRAQQAEETILELQNDLEQKIETLRQAEETIQAKDEEILQQAGQIKKLSNKLNTLRDLMGYSGKKKGKEFETQMVLISQSKDEIQSSLNAMIDRIALGFAEGKDDIDEELQKADIPIPPAPGGEDTTLPPESSLDDILQSCGEYVTLESMQANNESSQPIDQAQVQNQNAEIYNKKMRSAFRYMKQESDRLAETVSDPQELERRMSELKSQIEGQVTKIRTDYKEAEKGHVQQKIVSFLLKTVKGVKLPKEVLDKIAPKGGDFSKKEYEELKGKNDKLLQRLEHKQKQLDELGLELTECKNENSKLTMAIQELSVKFEEMKAMLKKKGIDTSAIDSAMQESGLEDIHMLAMKGKKVFDRLYYDAMQRLYRRQKLRQRILEAVQGELHQVLHVLDGRNPGDPNNVDCAKQLIGQNIGSALRSQPVKQPPRVAKATKTRGPTVSASVSNIELTSNFCAEPKLKEFVMPGETLPRPVPVLNRALPERERAIIQERERSVPPDPLKSQQPISKQLILGLDNSRVQEESRGRDRMPKPRNFSPTRMYAPPGSPTSLKSGRASSFLSDSCTQSPKSPKNNLTSLLSPKPAVTVKSPHSPLSPQSSVDGPRQSEARGISCITLGPTSIATPKVIVRSADGSPLRRGISSKRKAAKSASPPPPSRNTGYDEGRVNGRSLSPAPGAPFLLGRGQTKEVPPPATVIKSPPRKASPSPEPEPRPQPQQQLFRLNLQEPPKKVPVERKRPATTSSYTKPPPPNNNPPISETLVVKGPINMSAICPGLGLSEPAVSSTHPVIKTSNTTIGQSAINKNQNISNKTGITGMKPPGYGQRPPGTAPAKMSRNKSQQSMHDSQEEYEGSSGVFMFSSHFSHASEKDKRFPHSSMSSHHISQDDNGKRTTSSCFTITALQKNEDKKQGGRLHKGLGSNIIKNSGSLPSLNIDQGAWLPNKNIRPGSRGQ